MICIREITTSDYFATSKKVTLLKGQFRFDYGQDHGDHFVVEPASEVNTVKISYETVGGKRGVAETITLSSGERHHLERIHNDIFTTTRELVVR